MDQESDPPPAPPAPPPLAPTPTNHRLSTLILRLLTVVSLLGALGLIVTDYTTLVYENNTTSFINFKFMYTYKYILAILVTGLGYTLWQAGLILYKIGSQDRSDSLGCFLGDLVISYFLATGAGAGFGATRDMKSEFQGTNADDFFNRGYAASTLVFLGFFFTAYFFITSFQNKVK